MDKRTERKHSEMTLLTGRIDDVQTYKQGRKCKLCNQLLTIYTPGPYCNTHQHEGTMVDLKKEEEKLLLQRRRSGAKKIQVKGKGTRITNWYKKIEDFSHCFDNLENIRTEVKCKVMKRKGVVYALYRF